MRRSLVLALAGGLLLPAPAEATLAWVDVPSATIRVARDDGSAARDLGPGEQPVVSPDGRTVAFLREQDGELDLAVAPTDGSAPPRRLAPEAAPRAFSPDGRTLVALRLARGGLIMVAIPLDGGPARRLADDAASVSGFVGRSVVLTLTPDPGRGPDRVVRVPLTGGPQRTLAGRAFLQSALAPSGRLATTSLDPSGAPELRLTRPRRRLTVPFGGDDFRTALAWLPGERRLLVEVLGVGRGTNAAELLDVRTGRRRVLARGLQEVDGISRDGRLVLASRGTNALAGGRILAVPVRRGGRTRVLARAASQPSGLVDPRVNRAVLSPPWT